MAPRQNEKVVRYKTLLDMAHQAGLVNIETELVELPCESNGHTAVFRAIVTLEGTDGKTRRFTGFGDAAKNNVAPAMQTCLPRMAETRAKARALRDAVNIGGVSAEELADYSEEGAGYGNGNRTAYAKNGTETVRKPKPEADPNAPAQDGQKNAIASLCRKYGQTPPDMTGWTFLRASAFIQELQKAAA